MTMCDFHSICIRLDGAIAHVSGNSHSQAVTAAGWRENDQPVETGVQRFWEWEWNGRGEIPPIERLLKNYSAETPQRVVDVATLHAKKLSDALKSGIIAPPFDQPEYSDVRLKIVEDGNAPPATWALLAKDDNSDVRYYAASNTSTPPDSLALLAKDDNSGVRSSAARNTSTPKPEAAAK
jgi:hypothetical protein